MISFCMETPGDLTKLEEVVLEIADEFDMSVFYGSAEVRDRLQENVPSLSRKNSRVALFSKYLSNDQFTVSFGNVGLATYQVAAGFNYEGGNGEAARAFSKTVVARLSTHWSVKEIPGSAGGVSPDPSCE